MKEQYINKDLLEQTNHTILKEEVHIMELEQEKQEVKQDMIVQHLSITIPFSTVAFLSTVVGVKLMHSEKFFVETVGEAAIIFGMYSGVLATISIFSLIESLKYYIELGKQIQEETESVQKVKKERTFILDEIDNPRKAK